MSEPSMSPFSTFLELATGRLEPARKLVERRMRDLQGLYLDDVPGDRLDELAYEVSEIPVPASSSDVYSSTTILQPGAVGGEYNMTKGHFHANRDRAEIYLTLRGEGRLVMATEDGDHRVERMAPGTVNYVPGWWAHRSVNVGSEPLVFFAAYPADAGYDYGTIEEQGFPVLVVERDGEPAVVPNPRYGA